MSTRERAVVQLIEDAIEICDRMMPNIEQSIQLNPEYIPQFLYNERGVEREFRRLVDLALVKYRKRLEPKPDGESPYRNY